MRSWGADSGAKRAFQVDKYRPRLFWSYLIPAALVRLVFVFTSYRWLFWGNAKKVGIDFNYFISIEPQFVSNTKNQSVFRYWFSVIYNHQTNSGADLEHYLSSRVGSAFKNAVLLPVLGGNKEIILAHLKSIL